MSSWITESEACARVGRSRETLRAWRREGDLLGYSHGPGRLMFNTDELDACAALQRSRYDNRPLPGRPVLVTA